MLDIREPNEDLIEHTPPQVRILRDVFATPFVMEWTGGSGRRPYSGALYNRNNRLVRASQRLVNMRLTPADPPRTARPAAVTKLKGRGYYLGHLMGHYGHFITEGISPLWAPALADCDFVLAHPFIWRTTPKPTPLQRSAAGRWPLFAFMEAAFRRLGVDPDRIRLIDGPTVIEEVVVPDRLWASRIRANGAFQTIMDRLTADTRTPDPRLRLYLSRGGIPALKTTQITRAVGNEAGIEAIFADLGFTVVRPETLGFAEQLALYGRATVLAGLEGSALHNVLFCPPGAGVVSIGTPRTILNRNQPICGALVGGRTVGIDFIPGAGDGFDLAALAAVAGDAVAAALAPALPEMTP